MYPIEHKSSFVRIFKLSYICGRSVEGVEERREMEKQMDDMAEMIGFIASQMVAEASEKFSLATCPEIVFSTFVYGLIDKWLQLQDKQNKESFEQFIRDLRHCGKETY